MRSTLLASLVIVTATSQSGAQAPVDQAATFFVGRLKYANIKGDVCGGVGKNLVKLVGRVSTIPVRDTQVVALSDPKLFETPFLFMNGHESFTLSDSEVENLRIYFEHGGFLFASECCSRPAFPEAWKRELNRILPGESVQPLEYDHPIYRSFYRMDGVRSRSDGGNVYLQGLFLRDRLVAVLCEEGLCCAFSANNACNRGKGVTPEDGRKLALNIAVYALTN